MRRYLISSSLIHVSLLALVLFSPLFRSANGPLLMVEGFDYMGGGSGTGGSGGPKPAQMGQVVPQPVNVPVPSKPAPVQKAKVTEETWKVKDKPVPPPQKTQPVPEDAVETGEKEQKETTNIVSRGVSKNTKAGEGFEFENGSGGAGGGIGRGIGIGVGDGTGSGFGFGSYLRILRERIWGEWAENAVIGSNQMCIVSLLVNRSGQISDIKLDESSGDPFYDNVAMRAVRNSSPLPPLPPGFPKSEQKFRIQFRLVD